MEKRLQTINDDTVLEITESVTVKRRLSEKQLLRQKTYLEEGIAKFQSGLEDVNAGLAKIYAEKAQKQ